MKREFTPVPKGDYSATMTKFDIKPTKAGNGTIGSAQFELVGGDFGKTSEKKGRKVFHTFLIDHPNAKAVEFSNNKLNKLLAATGVTTTIEDLGYDYSGLMELAGDTKLTIGVDTNEYESNGSIVQGNRITSFKTK